uniref:Uncharacterized protein n=2 Tax=Anguilla anguilla TaxID=7936 RepID=A0A0E9RZN7_ANGAN
MLKRKGRAPSHSYFTYVMTVHTAFQNGSALTGYKRVRIYMSRQAVWDTQTLLLRMLSSHVYTVWV